MPSYRIGFGSDFNLRDAKVGIGTTLGRTKLDVVGVSKADFNISGVSTLTSYAGLVGQRQNIIDATVTGVNTTGVGTFVQVNETQTGFENLSGDFNTVSEDIIVDEGRIFQVSSGSTVSVGTLEHVSIGTHFSVPKGGITSRPREPREGMVRFNDDLNTLEFYNGVEWRQFTVTGASGRGVFGGGGTPTRTATIDYINISSTGNAVNFGNLTVSRSGLTACSSPTRGLFGGGNDPSVNVNTIDYITIASEGNAIDFGDLLNTVRHSAGLSSTVRGIFGGGFSDTNVIQYVQINTLGNTLDFGDLMEAVYGSGACSSSTRGVFAGGNKPNISKSIQYITISSTGNAVNFGDLTQERGYPSGSSNSTRGIFSNGFVPVTFSNTIDYITIASTGNAVDFGDTSRNSYGAQGCATSTRSIVAVGEVQSPLTTILNVIEYVQINTTSNSFDFGDLTVSRFILASCSDSHGGLGGF